MEIKVGIVLQWRDDVLESTAKRSIANCKLNIAKGKLQEDWKLESTGESVGKTGTKIVENLGKAKHYPSELPIATLQCSSCNLQSPGWNRFNWG